MSKKRKYRRVEVDPETGHHKCHGCGKWKAPEEFGKNPRMAAGRKAECRRCLATNYRDLPIVERAKILLRTSAQLAKRRGHKPCTATPEQAAEAYSGSCDMCLRPEGEVKLGIEHNHDTGRMRGWVCTRCNTIIGFIDQIGIQKMVLFFREDDLEFWNEVRTYLGGGFRPNVVSQDRRMRQDFTPQAL